MVSVGNPNISLEDIMNRTTEFDIVSHYFNITEIPCVINSPLRKDNHPSFGFYSLDGNKIYYKDLSNHDRGGIFDLLEKYWGVSYIEVLRKVWEDLPNFINTNCTYNNLGNKVNYIGNKSNVTLNCKVREWKDYDINYWRSYGVSLKWLKYANVYPISHKIVTKNNKNFIFPADKYAYAFIEKKEGKVTMKIYQPYNKQGYKWNTSTDRSVISLWTKIPEYGDKVVICSSLKDALCLMCNTHIPCLALQGEGYSMSNTAINELKRRYKNIYILFDCDAPGILDGKKLAEQTGFINIVLPYINQCKDISDLYKSLQDKNEFNKIILKLFEL